MKLLKGQRVTVDGLPAAWVDYEATGKQGQVTYTLHCKNWMLFAGHSLLAIQCVVGAVHGNENLLTLLEAKYFPVYERAIGSLKVGNRPTDLDGQTSWSSRDISEILKGFALLGFLVFAVWRRRMKKE